MFVGKITSLLGKNALLLIIRWGPVNRLVISASCEWSCALPRVSWVEFGRQNYEHFALSAANKPMDQVQKI